VQDVLDGAILKQIREQLEAKKYNKAGKRAGRTAVFDTASQIEYLHTSLERTEEDLMKSLNVGQMLLDRTVQLNGTITSRNEEISGLKREIDALKNAVREQEVAMAMLVQENRELTSTEHKHARRQSNAHRMMQHVQDELKVLEAKEKALEDMRARLDDAERRKLQLEMMVDHEQRQRSALQAEMARMVSEVSRLRDECNVLESERTTHDIEYAQLDAAHVQLKNEHAALKAQLDQRSSAHEDTKQKIADLEDARNLSEHEVVTLRNLVSELRRRLDIAEKKAQDARTHLEASEAESRARLLAHTSTFVSMSEAPPEILAALQRQKSQMPEDEPQSVAVQRRTSEGSVRSPGRSSFVTPLRRPNNKNDKFRNINSPRASRDYGSSAPVGRLHEPLLSGEDDDTDEDEDPSTDDYHDARAGYTPVKTPDRETMVSPTPRAEAADNKATIARAASAQETSEDHTETDAVSSPSGTSASDKEAILKEMERKLLTFKRQLDERERQLLERESRQLDRESDALLSKKEEAKKKGCCTVL
jgi:hypothetical protein